MSRPLRIPHPKTTLHLYRHLLREASYLPALARPFVDDQIKGQFRRHKADEAERCKRHIRQAHHDLRFLRAANAGDIVRMRRVLLRALGRVGRRRRELMADLLHREAPTNTNELEKYASEAAAIASERRKLDWLDGWDVDKLRVFARSQAGAGLPNPPRAPITVFQTVPAKCIPTENAWGRPLTPKLYRTKLKKMWKAVADKCLPPLPKEEWDVLGGIAQGRVRDPRQLPQPRRPVAQSIFGEPEAPAWNWQAYAIRPVSVVDRQASQRNKLLSGAVDDNTPTGDPQPVNCHNYTPRTWRRLLANVWQLTATMEKRPTGRGWNVVWGKLEYQAPPATGRNMEFFRDLPMGEDAQLLQSRGDK
ncbi:hypothetical protein VTK56DRAFT_8123 [Thermocarpiscus australiensis]